MIKDFSTVFWGYLPMTKEPYKVHEKVNAFIGPSGHGKTTIWDGLRLMLGASHFESKRTFSFYVHKKSNWAVVRVAFYNLPINGVRPFETHRKFKDEVTACCRIFKNDQGSWSREFYFFDGEFYDLADLQLNTKAYSEASLNVGQYLQLLEECLGITKEFRNLMSMSPDTVREVVNSSPHTLFQLIFNLKGTKDYKKRYDDSKEKLGAQEVEIQRAEEEMEQARVRFEGTKSKAKKFRLYKAKEKEVEETTNKLKKLEYIEIQETLTLTQEEMIHIEEQVNRESDKVNELTVGIAFKQKEIDRMKEEYKQIVSDEEKASDELINLIKDKTLKDSKINDLNKQINDIKKIEPQSIDYLIEMKNMLIVDLEQEKVDSFQEQRKFNQLKQKLSDLDMNLLPYKDEAKKFRQVLEKSQIPYIMLADAISIKPEMKKWQEAIEAFIGNNRYRIIVESDQYLITKKLQQKAKYGARVSLPKNQVIRITESNIQYPSIRSALIVNQQEKVEGYLGRLNHVYLVETVEEGHALQAEGIESITIEGLLQDGDGAIHLKYHSLCCGKLAIEEEKERTKEMLLKQESIVRDFEKSVNKIECELKEVIIEIKNQERVAELPVMENSYCILLNEVKKLSEFINEVTIIKTLAKQKREEIREKEQDAAAEKSKFTEKRNQALKNVGNFSKRHAELQNKCSSLVSNMERALAKVKASGVSEEDIELLPYEIQGDAFKDQQGNLITSKEMQDKLNILFREKEDFYDPSVNDEIVRLVEAQEGQVELLEQNLKRLKEDRSELERTCNDLLYQFRDHIKEIMKNYIAEFTNLADLLKATAKGKVAEVTPEPETWEIHLFIGYDGKDPVSVDGPDLSSGQKASTSLMILLAALSDSKYGRTTPIMFLDEPKARVDDDRGNEIGQLLQVTNIQYFITHQQGESLKTIDWIDHAFTCSARESGKEFANPLILKKRARRIL